MSIAHVSSTTDTNTGATTLTNSSGDFIFLLLLNTGSSSTPLVPTGFSDASTAITGQDSTHGFAMRAVYRFATGANETIPSVTNCTSIVAGVYSGVNTTTPISNVLGQAGTGTSVSWSGVVSYPHSVDWTVTLATGNSTAGNYGATTPTSMTTFQEYKAGIDDAVIYDSNGPLSAYSFNSKTMAASTNWITKTLVIQAAAGGSTLTKTQSAIARIATNPTKTQTATARIQKSITKTQTAIARIQKVVTKTQSATSRIATIRTKTQSATARISMNMSGLVDPFNQNTLNTTIWTQTTLGSATLTYDATGATVTYPASTTSSMDGDIVTNGSYDMTGSGVYLQVLSVPSNGGATTTDAFVQAYIDGSNKLTILWEGGSLYAQKMVGGVNTNITSVTYNSTTHKWWRIRESSGTTYWETSPDNTTWTALTSQSNPIAVTGLKVLIAGTAYASASSPGTFKWNNLNTPGSLILTKTQSSTARIANTITKTQSSIARIAINSTKTQSAISRIANTLTKTQSAVSRIANIRTKTQTAIASVKVFVTKTQSAVARVATNKTATQSAISRISKTFTKTQPAISRIANNRTKTQTATANIINNSAVTKTQSAVARIANILTKTQAAAARIAKNISATQSAVARIANNRTKTQSSIARISITSTKTQTATGRISNTKTKTQSSISRIANSFFVTQPATAMVVINQIFTKVQSAVARIQTVVTKTQPASARISNTRSKTQTAIAHISKTFTSVQTVVARIAANRTKTQPAVARIQVTAIKTQSATGRIANVRQALQTATARVVSKTIKGETTTLGVSSDDYAALDFTLDGDQVTIGASNDNNIVVI